MSKDKSRYKSGDVVLVRMKIAELAKGELKGWGHYCLVQNGETFEPGVYVQEKDILGRADDIIKAAEEGVAARYDDVKVS